MKENLNLKIGVLEAKCGLEPKVKTSKKIAGKIKEVPSPFEELEKLRKTKINTKIFHLKKEIKKNIKKTKAFEIQKICRGMAQSENVEEKAKLEEKIKEIKLPYNPDHVASFLFKKMVETDDYLKSKIEVENVSLTADHPILKSKKLEKIVSNIKETFLYFLKKLYHDIEEKEEIETAAANENSESEDLEDESNDEKIKTDGALFVSSLCDDDISESEDEIDGNSLPKKKKNRMGQAARRKLYEIQHGKNANHLKKQKEIEEMKKRKIEETKKVAATNSKLHPSWEAKKAQKAKIEQFKGKKIKFEDE